MIGFLQVLIGLACLIYVVLGVAVAVEYPNAGTMPTYRLGRAIFRICIILLWLPLVGVHFSAKCFKWLFS